MTRTGWMQEAERSQYVDIGKRRDAADARCGHNPKGRDDMGVFRRRQPLQYRHIASGLLLELQPISPPSRPRGAYSEVP
jgi:hypothetical protein